MTLNDYLESRGKGAAAELATAINVSPVLISQWRTGRRPVPAEHCPPIEQASGGAVTCEELLPGVNWAYLRGGQS